jgi:hypothetical protein
MRARRRPIPTRLKAGNSTEPRQIAMPMRNLRWQGGVSPSGHAASAIFSRARSVTYAGPKMAEEQMTGRYGAILAQQQKDWPTHLQGAKTGNPYATLCSHCYGRHAPPKDEICDKEPVPG